MRSSNLRDRQFNFSLQTIKLCKDLIKQDEYALSNQLIDDAILLHSWIAKPKGPKVDLSKDLADLSALINKTGSQLLAKGEYSDYVKHTKYMLDKCQDEF